MLATIAVLNVKEPLAETTRLSAPLFCSVMDPPDAKPLTVPPMVKGPPPPPQLTVQPPVPIAWLQPARIIKLIKRDTKKENLSGDFISASLLLVPACDGQAAANFRKLGFTQLCSPAIAWARSRERAMRTRTKLPQQAIPPEARTFFRVWERTRLKQYGRAVMCLLEH